MEDKDIVSVPCWYIFPSSSFLFPETGILLTFYVCPFPAGARAGNSSFR